MVLAADVTANFALPRKEAGRLDWEVVVDLQIVETVVDAVLTAAPWRVKDRVVLGGKIIHVQDRPLLLPDQWPHDLVNS